MPRYTVSITGPGEAASRWLPMLDVLPAAALVGDETTATATLFFDVTAHDADSAIEHAYHRAHSAHAHVPGATLSVVRAREVWGRRLRWRRPPR